MAVVCGNGGRAGLCLFHDDPVEVARQALQERIVAQPFTIETITLALSSWHHRYRTKPSIGPDGIVSVPGIVSAKCLEYLVYYGLPG